ncbi:hypothetical protein FOMA001_g5587 [Fusarium oxysporum f. sp. matthiolae]|nr:hypothetical protein FOMA001_g5587 [Fusarium oxysporum f. sp. matthiolae]
MSESVKTTPNATASQMHTSTRKPAAQTRRYARKIPRKPLQ